MLHVLFHENGVVADISEEALEGYLPADETCTSTLALRYKSENGQAVDMYPGLSDEEVLAAIKANSEQEAVAPQTPGKILDHIDFYNLFTIDELAAVYTAAKENVYLQIFLDKIKVSRRLSSKTLMLSLV
jgi:hypothetical protein